MAQKQMRGIDWLRAHVCSIVQGQPPLNHGTRYAVAVTGQLPGVVTGNVIAACAWSSSGTLIPRTATPSSGDRGPIQPAPNTATGD
jgi:hypothetical protein